MEKKKLFVIICFQLLLSITSFAQDTLSVPEPILSEIISKFPSVRDLTVSAEEDEMFFTVQSYLGEISAIAYCKKKGGKWALARLASFSGKYQDMEPSLSQDGLRLYFASNRPLENKGEAKDFDIWYVEREYKSGIWSEPKNIGEPVNTKEDEFYPSLSSTKNICFTRDGNGSKGKDDIFYAEWKNDKYENPFSMSDSINSTGIEFNSFLAPDESFIIFTCYNKPGDFGSGDLYISFKKNNNEWTTAKNLGEEINSKQMDYCPFVNTNSGMLYFTSRRTAVKSQFDSAQTFTDLFKEMNRYDNGLSRIYQVNIGKIIQNKMK